MVELRFVAVIRENSGSDMAYSDSKGSIDAAIAAARANFQSQFLREPDCYVIICYRFCPACRIWNHLDATHCKCGQALRG